MSDDEGVFEIVDHTCASPWERLIASIEELITNWHLNNTMGFDSYDISRSSHGKSGSNHEIVSTQGGKSYLLYHYFTAEQDESVPEEEKDAWRVHGKFLKFKERTSYVENQIHNIDNEFRKDTHFLHQWFGLSEFLLLCSVEDELSISVSEARMLMSALSIATQNVRCRLACFVPVGEESRNNYLGFLTDEGVEVRFHTSHLPYVPKSHSHLSGLADFFVSKLDPNTPVQITNSACFTFTMRNWYAEDWRIYGEIKTGPTFGSLNLPLHTLRWGPKNDPLEHLQLSTQWPEFTQDAVLDNAVYSELDPENAPIWTLSRSFRSNILCTMSELLYSLSSNYVSIMDISKGFDLKGERKGNIADSVGSAISSVVRRTQESLTPEYIQAVKDALFKESEERGNVDSSILHRLDITETEKIYPKYGKIAPKNSLTWLIALHTSNEIIDQDTYNLSTIWNEIVKQIRIHWEDEKPFSKLTREAPNLKYTLLHQKIQMLDFCIMKKKSLKARDHVTSVTKSSDGWEGEMSDEDTFYEMSEDPKDEKNEGREGHLIKLENAKMKNGFDIYIPETQDQGPLTEDMLQEQQMMLESLGTSPNAGLLRQKLQTSQLKSDMEAFKAANPGAELEDFVQWHSPNDWIATEGSLSARMQDEENLWRRLWREAEPISVRRQKLLFNHEQEANKVLHHLENMTIEDLFQQILPTVFFIAYDTMISQTKMMKFKIIADKVRSYSTDIVEFNWSSISSAEGLLNLLHKVHDIEVLMSRALSLYHKIPGEYTLIERLLTRDEVLLHKPNERESISALFSREGSMGTSPPETREFVLRTMSSHPYSHSKKLPHRLYASLTRNEFRVVESFSNDLSLY